MATEETASASAPSAEVVGNAFVEQYYLILHQSPGLVHRFYQDSSFLSRPDASGKMATVTSMQAINEKILSLNYEEYTAEINTADAQESHGKGVIVLVTGCLTGKDNVKKRFTQTFFLAPQDKGYFVLNDVFRFVDKYEPLQNDAVPVDTIKETAPPPSLNPEPAPPSVFTPEPEPIEANVPLQPEITVTAEEEDNTDGAEVCDPSEQEKESAIKEEIVEPPSEAFPSEASLISDTVPEDTQKKSYASIVKVMKSNSATTPSYVPRSKASMAVASLQKQPAQSAKPPAQLETLATGGDTVSDSNDVHEEEGHSIHVRNLPFNATVSQLDEKFSKFGPIKPGGIQVRSNKLGFCFGFVEFEAASSVQSALQASPIIIGGREAVIEEKRTNTRVGGGGGGRGRYSSGRTGFRSDSFKNRGNFGGRGYGRNEHRSPRGPSARSGEDNQLNDQQEPKRGAGQGGTKGSSTTT